MQEKSLETTFKQRVTIIIIAILLLISTFGAYALIVMMSGGGNAASVQAITERYNAKYEEYLAANESVSEQYFSEFSKYRANVKAYNEASATNGVLDTKDLKQGNGRELADGDTDYAAYYIGWCADGTVFDSSFDVASTEATDSSADIDITSATALVPPLFGATMAESLIDGWNQGVIGMKLGGVRQITMNGDLAYGDTREICGGTNKPLRFIVMLVEPNAELASLQEELNEIQMELYAAYMKTSNTGTSSAVDGVTIEE